MRLFRKLIRKLISRTDAYVKRKSYDPVRQPGTFYETKFLPAEASLLRAGNFRLFSAYSKPLIRELKNQINLNLNDEQKKDKAFVAHIEKEYIKCYLFNHMQPNEFFLYRLYEKSLTEREHWLSDRERWDVLHQRFKTAIHNEINEKLSFYSLAKDFFKREACEVSAITSLESFVDFINRHHDIFIKPMEGYYGHRTYKLRVKNSQEASNVWKKLSDNGRWIVEELIVQDERMAKWNRSSVNTVRIPSFITAEGKHHILVPIFRAGSKGKIVDNTSSGGYYASIDPDTGVINSDGVDKEGLYVEKHPDTKIKFKGWQVPEWQELKSICERLHRSLPPHHRYVAFDFALSSTKGWMVIEANWGQLFGQGPANHGIRKEFFEYTKK